MEIIKRLAKDIKIGDILIVDYEEIARLPISIIGNFSKMEEKIEGDSTIFIYEVDDIDYDGKDIIFYHMNGDFDDYFNISVPKKLKYEFDVILNQFKDSTNCG